MTKSKGPGKSYRKGVTLMEAVKMFDTEEKAESWFVARRWPDGIACPHCGSVNVADVASRKPQPYRCRDCRKHFSVKTKTLLHSSNIPLSKWAISFYLFSTNLRGVSSMKLHRDLGIGQKAAWYMGHRIRQTWGEPEEKFAGPTEADETYIGGKEGNKHKDKKLNAGRGTAGKAPVAGVLDRPTNQVVVRPVENTKRETLQGFVEGATEEGAAVYTDEHAGYKGINRPHEWVSHSTGEYVKYLTAGDISTAGMDSFWATLKRGISGSFFHISVKHLDSYCSEFSGRHNARPFDTVDQMDAMGNGINHGPLGYDRLIGKESAGEPENLPEGQMAFEIE